MPTVNAGAIRMYNPDTMDIHIFGSGGKTLAVVNVSAEGDPVTKLPKVTITYAEGIAKIEVVEVKGE